jgi:hypothetical protein
VSAPASQALTLQVLFEAKALPYLTAFDTAFDKAASVIGNVGDYAEQFIYEPAQLAAPNVAILRLPVPLTAPELKLFKGRTHFQKSSTGFIELTKKPYNGGVQEFFDKVNAADWTGFGTAPEVYAGLVASWPSQNAVGLIATANSTLSWDGITNFLATTKYSNPFKPKMTIPGSATLCTYKNYWAGTTLNVAGVQLLRNDLISRRGFDARPLGYKGTHLVHSTDLTGDAEATCLDLRLPGGATNPIEKYKIIPEPWYDLPAKTWGLIHKDANRPIFVASKGSPMTQVYGVQSAMFEKSREIGWNVYVQLGVALARSESISIATNP